MPSKSAASPKGPGGQGDLILHKGRSLSPISTSSSKHTRIRDPHDADNTTGSAAESPQSPSEKHATDDLDSSQWKVRTHTDTGEPVWLAHAGKPNIIEGPWWQRTFDEPEVTHGGAMGSDKLQLRGRKTKPRVESELAKRTRAALDEFEGRAEETHREDEKARRWGSPPTLQTLTVRQLQINELRTTNLINQLITGRVPLSKIRLEFEKAVSAESDRPQEGLPRESFFALLRTLCPAATMDEGRMESIFQAFDTDGNGYIDFTEFFSLIGLLCSEPEKDLEVTYFFNVLDTDGTKRIPRARLAKSCILGLKQAVAAKRRWTRLANCWERVMGQSEHKYFLTLDDIRVLVYGDDALCAAFDRLRPFA